MNNQNQQQQERNVNWSLSESEANYIVGLIAKRPIEEAQMLFHKLIGMSQPEQTQINPNVQPIEKEKKQG